MDKTGKPGKGILEAGARVRLTQEVERYPSFVASKGALGTVDSVSQSDVWVKMDDTLDNCEEWDNKIHWELGHAEGSGYRYEDDVEVVA